MGDEEIEDEMRDLVFDYGDSQALVLMAEDFLQEAKLGDETKSIGIKSKRSTTSSSKVIQNKYNAFKYDPLKVKLLQDKLSVTEKERLEAMLKDIEENLDEIKKEKD